MSADVLECHYCTTYRTCVSVVSMAVVNSSMLLPLPHPPHPAPPHSPTPSTDEEYEILSELPEAEVTFYCRLCERPTMDAQWRRAVQAEVQAAFKLILMSLEKEEWFKSLLAKGTTPEVRTSERLLLVSNVLMCVHRVACLL